MIIETDENKNDIIKNSTLIENYMFLCYKAIEDMNKDSLKSIPKQYQIKTSREESQLRKYCLTNDILSVKHICLTCDDIYLLKTLLESASSYNRLDMVKVLIENSKLKTNMNINCVFSFVLACKNNSFDVVKYLIEKGISVNAYNGQGLMYSCEFGGFKVVKYLIDNGADGHVDDDYCVRHAIFKGYFNIVKYLIEHGANKNIALRTSKKYCKKEITKYLISI